MKPKTRDNIFPVSEILFKTLIGALLLLAMVLGYLAFRLIDFGTFLKFVLVGLILYLSYLLGDFILGD